jgi:hypothetical protein
VLKIGFSTPQFFQIDKIAGILFTVYSIKNLIFYSVAIALSGIVEGFMPEGLVGYRLKDRCTYSRYEHRPALN